jgi:hypothetical protein
MNSVADQPVSPMLIEPADTWVPSFPKGLVRSLFIDMAVPWIALQVLTRVWGLPDVAAFAVAALFPAGSMLVNWRRRRRVDSIGLVVLVTLTGAVILALIMHDIRYALLKPAVGAALFGLACLLTLGRKAPLMFFFARQVTAGDDPARLAAWNARLGNSGGFRHAMRLLTLVWGLALLGKAALWTAIVLLLPPSAAVVAAPVLGIGLFGALMAWTIAFARRGAARLAAGQAEEEL